MRHIILDEQAFKKTREMDLLAAILYAEFDINLLFGRTGEFKIVKVLPETESFSKEEWDQMAFSLSGRKKEIS